MMRGVPCVEVTLGRSTSEPVTLSAGMAVDARRSRAIEDAHTRLVITVMGVASRINIPTGDCQKA
jgi:hypothetical protein